MPTFDVIIPAYNAAHYLPKSLDSVIAQTFNDWRILLVDDGSTDNTPEVVALYQERLGDKLRYIRQSNARMSAARNTAIRQATAEFLAFLDADDIWLPNRLQTAYERFLTSPNIGLTYGFVARIDPAGQIIDVFDRPSPHAEGRVARYLYMRMLDIPCPTVTVRASCIREAGAFDETLRASEDRDVWLRIASRHDVALIPEVVALYRVSPHSQSSDLDRMSRAQLHLIEKHYGSPDCGWLARRVALSWVYRQRAEGLGDRGKLPAAVGDAVRAVLYFPFQVHTLRTLVSLLLRYARHMVKRSSKLPA